MRSNHTSMVDYIKEHQMIAPRDTVLVAVSGGADSIYLLERLHSLRYFLDFDVVALHFNHQLRGAESDRDEQFVCDFVDKHCGEGRVNDILYPKISLIVDSAPVADLAKANGTGIEEEARNQRYAFFQRIAAQYPEGRVKIATAHNANDNAETILMALTRGTGLRGLTGIPPVRGNIIRPALTTTRAEIEDYLRLYSIPHIEDSTNADTTFTRNRIRHQVMPILHELNPNFLQNTTEMTANLREDEVFLAQLSAEQMPAIAETEDTLSLSALKLSALPAPLALRCIAQLAQRLIPDLVLERDHRADVLAICLSDDPSARVNLPCGLLARREYDNLVFTLTQSHTPISPTTISAPTELTLGCCHIAISRGIYAGEATPPNDIWVDGNLPALSVRMRQERDTLQRPNRANRTVKKLMIDEKIPRHLRDFLPVLHVSDTVVAVAELGVAQWCLPQLGTDAWHIIFTQL